MQCMAKSSFPSATDGCGDGAEAAFTGDLAAFDAGVEPVQAIDNTRAAAIDEQNRNDLINSSDWLLELSTSLTYRH